MTTPPEPCRTCDGTGYVETAAQDSRVIHHEPCPDCSGPVPAPSPLARALVVEYVDLLARRGHWRGSTWHTPTSPELIFEQGARAALLHVAERLGVTDLHERAAEMVARGAGDG